MCHSSPRPGGWESKPGACARVCVPKLLKRMETGLQRGNPPPGGCFHPPPLSPFLASAHDQQLQQKIFKSMHHDKTCKRSGLTKILKWSGIYARSSFLPMYVKVEISLIKESKYIFLPSTAFPAIYSYLENRANW